MIARALLLALLVVSAAPSWASESCDPARQCFGLEQATCDAARDGRDCLRLARAGWQVACGGPGPGSLWCRQVVEPVQAADANPAVRAALLGPPLAARLAGSVEARIAADAPVVLLGPYPAEGSQPIPAVFVEGALRVVVGEDPRVLFQVDARAAVPVLTEPTVVHGDPSAEVRVVLRPGARIAALTTDPDPRVRTLGPVEVDVLVRGAAIGTVFALPQAGEGGDRCAAAGAPLTDAAGAEIARIASSAPCVAGFRVIEQVGERALVALETEELDVRAYLAESSLTPPIPGLSTSVGPVGLAAGAGDLDDASQRPVGAAAGSNTGFGASDGAGETDAPDPPSGSAPPADASSPGVRRVAAGTWLYDAPGGRPIGVVRAERPLRGVQARPDGWWRAVVHRGIGEASAWIAPDPPLAGAAQPPRATQRAGTVQAPGGCGCASKPPISSALGPARTPHLLLVLGLGLAALRRRAPIRAPRRR